jgi:phytoene dehydrogenase-like protein
MAQHYDIAVIGAQPSAVIAAALLAKRGRRVILVDHAENATTYGRKGFRLPLLPTLVPQHDSSPPIQRVHEELGLGPELRAATRALSPGFQALLPRHRFDVHADVGALGDELAREFPREAGAVATFLKRLMAADDELTAILRDALPVPARGLGERWRSRGWRGRSAPFAAPFDPATWLVGIDADHPLHDVLLSPHAFFGYVPSDAPSTFHAVRLLARYFRGVVEFTDRLGGLPAFLLRAARQAGVELRQGATAKGVQVKGRRLVQVEVEGERQDLSADYFIAGTLSPFSELLPASAQHPKFLGEEQAVRAAGSLLVMNLLVDRQVIPCGLGHSALLLNGRRRTREDAPVDPPVLLQRFAAVSNDGGLLRVAEDQEVLSVACPVRTADLEHSPDRLAAMRLQLTARVGRVVPFLLDYVRDASIPVDTGSWDLESDGARRVDPWRLHPLYEMARTPMLGVAARSPRTYFKNLWHCGHDVVPGLGLEGDYVAGLATAEGILKDAGSRWARKG